MDVCYYRLCKRAKNGKQEIVVDMDQNLLESVKIQNVPFVMTRLKSDVPFEEVVNTIQPAWFTSLIHW